MTLRAVVLLVVAVMTLTGCIIVPAYPPGYYGGGYGSWYGGGRHRHYRD